MAGLSLQSICKTFGTTDVIKNVNIEAHDGEFIVLVGPSGCGKSTLLRMIAGLETETSGSIEIGEEDVTGRSPGDRGIAMVFQSYALYPHMNVRKNMSFGLENLSFPKDEINKRVANAAEMLALTPYLDRRPKELSGGQRQRVAIGRAIVREPSVFLFDEPLSNLDAKLRVHTRGELINLHRSLKATMVYVTHDQVEAMTMADRIVVMNDGRVEQIGTPIELFEKPANLFVAGFIGSPRMNMIDAKVIDVAGTLKLDLTSLGQIDMPESDLPLAAGDEIVVGIRPSHVTLNGETSSHAVTVRYAESLGNETFIHSVLSGTEHEMVLHVPYHLQVENGATMKFDMPAKHIHLFRKSDGVRIQSAARPETEAA